MACNYHTDQTNFWESMVAIGSRRPNEGFFACVPRQLGMHTGIPVTSNEYTQIRVESQEWTNSPYQITLLPSAFKSSPPTYVYKKYQHSF